MTAKLKKAQPSQSETLVDSLYAALVDAKKAETLNDWMRSFHLIKGYAQLLGMQRVQEVAHELESKVVHLLQESRTQISESQIQAMFADGIAKLRRELDGFHADQIQMAAGKMGLRSKFWKRIESAVYSVALQLGRQVEIEFDGDIDALLKPEWSEPVFAAFLHAIRNSVDHGAVAGRPMLFKFSAFKDGKACVFSCEDNGAGIDPKRVREMAERKGVRTKPELAKMDDFDVLQLLFEPGFSLKETATPISGRGYGLDVAYDGIVRKLGGTLELDSNPSGGTLLVATLLV